MKKKSISERAIIGFDHGLPCRVKNMDLGPQLRQKPRPSASVFVYWVPRAMFFTQHGRPWSNPTTWHYWSHHYFKLADGISRAIESLGLLKKCVFVLPTNVCARCLVIITGGYNSILHSATNKKSHNPKLTPLTFISHCCQFMSSVFIYFYFSTNNTWSSQNINTSKTPHVMCKTLNSGVRLV